MIKKFVGTIAKNFSMTSLGESTTFLGLQIERNRTKGTLNIYQKYYIETIIDKFNLEGSYSDIPMSASLLLKKSSHRNDKILRNIPYRELIGCLMYVSVQTRPNVAYSVSKLARYC